MAIHVTVDDVAGMYICMLGLRLGHVFFGSGFVQSSGWPVVVAVVENWFGRARCVGMLVLYEMLCM